MKYFASNLKYLRNKNNVEQTEVANYLGRKSTSSISEWESGKHIPNSGTLSDLARFFHVTLEDLVETDLSKVGNNIEEVSRMISIPVLGEVAAGEPIFAERNYDDYKHRPANELPTGELFYIRAKGNSMSPVISDKAFVLCRKQEDVENGEIAVVLINGDTETTLKKISKQTAQIKGVSQEIIMLEPINNEYNLIMVTEDNPIRILGKAIEVTNVL